MATINPNTMEDKVHRICQNIIPYFSQTYFERYINDYKMYFGYTADRAKLIKKWQSNVFIPLTATIVDTFYASTFDSRMKFNLNGGVEGQETLLNNAFDYNGSGREALLQTIKESIITGKGYLKPIFNIVKEDIMINGTNYGKTKKRPELKYVSVFDVFYDYNTKIDESPFHVTRSIMTEKIIKKTFLSKMLGKKPDEESILKANTALDSILKKESRRYSELDFSRVKNLLSYQDIIKKRKLDTTAGTVWTRTPGKQSTTDGHIDDTITSRNSVFGIDFKKNSVHEVIEYMDDDNNYVVMINGNMLFKTKQFHDINKVFDISYGNIPGTSDSIGIGSALGDLQKQINTLQNIFLDGVKLDAAPMFEQVGGLEQLLGNKNEVNYEAFKIIPTKTAGGLKKIELGLGGWEPANAVQALTDTAQQRAGTNEYMLGGNGTVQRVSGGVDLIVNQFKSKLAPLINSVNQMMGRMAKSILIMYARFYTAEELKELAGIKEEFSIEDLINEEGITFQLTALALLEKEEGIKNLLDNLGPIANFMGGLDSPNIDAKELLKQILTKEVDIDKLFPDTPIQQAQGGFDPNFKPGGPKPIPGVPQQEFQQRPSLNELANQAITN